MMKTMPGPAVAAAALLAGALFVAPKAVAADRLLVVDLEKLVSRADLTYDSPATRSEEGMPVGNGRMGSLVWTTPSVALEPKGATPRPLTVP